MSLVLPSSSWVYSSACLVALECVISCPISLWGLNQHQPKGNNYNPSGHLMQHLYCTYVVALQSATVEKPLEMRHLEFPEMKAEVANVALFRFLLRHVFLWVSWGAVAMLREFLRQRTKENTQPDPIPISKAGTRAELAIGSQPVWVWTTFASLAKGRHGSGGFFGGFLRWIFRSQSTKEKFCQKHPLANPPLKTINPPEHNPPKTTSWTKKSAAKSTNKSGRQTFKRTPGCLRLRRFAPGSVFRAWISWHFLLPSGHGRGCLAEMHLRSLSCCWWQGQGLLRTLSDATSSQRC